METMNSIMHTLMEKVDQNCSHIEELKACIGDIKNIVHSMGQFIEILEIPLHEHNKGNSDLILEKQGESKGDVHDKTEDVPAAQNEKNKSAENDGDERAHIEDHGEAKNEVKHDRPNQTHKIHLQ
ncbi:hypothetical protein JCGZ_20932 [Jatropha curcas]|uniref:Uncharacterized protein n=1 Tax=Jatropha curcas TaxID=180498 RepID=A0A067JTV0_JATCU|nr:hypothetical protein JCGZ_20932 [Jatropha curcas]